MSADIIQAQYDQLEALARRFGKQADLQIALQKRVQTNATRLRTAWVGRGSDAFFAEMDGKVFPAMQRLIAALREADRVTRQMSELVHQAEDEASRLFRARSDQTLEDSGVRPTSPYILPENQNGTSESRLEDIQTILGRTPAGQRVLLWLKEYNVTIDFGDTQNNAIAECSLDGRHIVIDRDYANLNDYELAAVLVHEGTHSLDTHPFDVPIAGPILNTWYNFQEDFMYAAYPFPEEYRAFRAQAEFWREVKAGLPSSRILGSVEDLIFDSSGNYRDTDVVYKELYNSYGYKDKLFGRFNP